MGMWDFFNNHPFCFFLMVLITAISFTRIAAHVSEAICCVHDDNKESPDGN